MNPLKKERKGQQVVSLVISIDHNATIPNQLRNQKLVVAGTPVRLTRSCLIFTEKEN